MRRACCVAAKTIPTASAEQRILVYAPVGRDSALICDVLGKEGIECTSCSGLEQLVAEMACGVGALVLTEETLRLAGVGELKESLAAQPKWSDVPCILLTARTSQNGAGRIQLQQKLGLANITILDRPTRSVTIATAALSALRARQRQYEARDFLDERIRIEENLRRTQKLESIGVLAGGIAHDFNNILTGILGNASLMLSDTRWEGPERTQLQEIVKSAERAADLTKQLLAYSGKGAFLIGAVDLTGLISETNQLIHLLIPKSVALTFNLSPDLPLVRGDASQLQQVIMNLVINAAEAIPPDRSGAVAVATTVQEVSERDLQRVLVGRDLAPGQFVVVEVRDNGVGMSEETLAKIFDPFFTTKFLGRGLGLSAVHGIVQGHKGALSVDTTPGRGTTFRIFLPATDFELAPSTPAPSAQRLSGSGTILVIDDEAVIRTFAKRTLEKLGYKVLVANDGREGVAAILHDWSIALVLLDATMPVMSGEETFRRIKAARPEVTVVLCSGYAESQAVAPFTSSDLAGFLQKPCTANQLIEKVSTVLRNRR
jgi:signal transduction histidine kinase/CheY-like chemotaxis protein